MAAPAAWCSAGAVLAVVFAAFASAQDGIPASWSEVTVPAWAGTTAGYGPYARTNPLGFLVALSKMPQEQQRLALKVVGERMKEQGNTDCNVFGGVEACKVLPSDSNFAQTCPEHDLQVDCAYYSDDLKEVANNPVDDLKRVLADRGVTDLEASCQDCFDNQRRMWCAQTVPKCGSFQTNVEAALLPALATVAAAQDGGQTPTDALADAVPMLLQAMSLSLPCREMCEAVVSTCSCSRDRKFGELLDLVIANHNLPGMELPDGFTRRMFGQVYNRPLCSLFANASAPGFSGACEALPTTCSNEQQWCTGDDGANPGPDVVEELMALQLAKGAFGWMASPQESLVLDERALQDSADTSDVKALEDRFVRRSSSGTPAPAKTGHAFMVTTVVVCSLLAGAALGAVAYMRWRQHRDRAGFREGYQGLAESEPPSSFMAPLTGASGDNQL